MIRPYCTCVWGAHGPACPALEGDNDPRDVWGNLLYDNEMPDLVWEGMS